MISNITSLQRKPQKEKAKALLDRIYSYVKPLMAKYKYTVGKLAEFYPKNKQLLGINVNHGARISLRLRDPHDETVFLPFESVLDTMLHELTHNTYGPHDQSFFAHWDKLRAELGGMMQKGFKGDLFMGQGRRLGGHPILRQPKAAAAKAALKRTGKRLGGDALVGSLREQALAAAERRRKADLQCVHADVDPDKLEEIKEEEVIDLT